MMASIEELIDNILFYMHLPFFNIISLYIHSMLKYLDKCDIHLCAIYSW